MDRIWKTFDQTTCANPTGQARQLAPKTFLVALRPRKTSCNLSFGLFLTFSGQAWPRDPLQRVRLEKWCNTHLKVAPEAKSKAISWRFPRLGPKTSIYNDGMIAGKKRPRKLLRMRPGIFEFEPGLGLKLGQTKSPNIRYPQSGIQRFRTTTAQPSEARSETVIPKRSPSCTTKTQLHLGRPTLYYSMLRNSASGPYI